MNYATYAFAKDGLQPAQYSNTKNCLKRTKTAPALIA